MYSDESDEEFEVLMKVIVNRRPRIIRNRRNLFNEFDEADFRIKFRMTKEAAWIVLELIRSKIQQKTNRNRIMSPEYMLLLTLRFFATGRIQRTGGGDHSGVSNTRAIKKLFRHIALLREKFVQIPAAVENQRQIQKEFYKIAKFPRILAAMGCTHAKIISPDGEDVEVFRNQNGYFSFNVQTFCDYNLNIMDIVARWPGAAHNATILRNSRIFSRFEANEFDNAVVVAGSGYPCNRWIMTPLLKVNSAAEGLYNESLIKSLNCVECAHGVWKRRFPILSLGMRTNANGAQAIIVATAVLHNICNSLNDKIAPSISDEVNALIDIEVAVPSFPNQNDNAYRREIIQNHFQVL